MPSARTIPRARECCCTEAQSGSVAERSGVCRSRSSSNGSSRLAAHFLDLGLRALRRRRCLALACALELPRLQVDLAREEAPELLRPHRCDLPPRLEFDRLDRLL